MAQARKHGWEYWILSDKDVWYRLPNTTIVGDFADMTAARKAFDDAVAATALDIKKPVVVEKSITVQYTVSRFTSDVTEAKKRA